MNDDDRVEAFDLPKGCEVDHVVIYRNNEYGEPHYYAVPFNLEDTFDDGTTWYNEPYDFEPTEKYRNAIDERSDIPIESIQIERPTLEVDYI